MESWQSSQLQVPETRELDRGSRSTGSIGIGGKNYKLLCAAGKEDNRFIMSGKNQLLIAIGAGFRPGAVTAPKVCSM